MLSCLPRALAAPVVLLALSGAVPGVAAAAAPRPADAGKGAGAAATKKKARDLYLAAESLFAAHDYEAALAKYRAAYDALPDVIFLFNIAQCLRLSGSDADALDMYRRYLAESPAAPNRADVEALIAELERKLHPLAGGPVPPPAGADGGSGTGAATGAGPDASPAPDALPGTGAGTRAPGAAVPPRASAPGLGLALPGIVLAAAGGIALGLSAWTGGRVLAANAALEGAPLETPDDFSDALARERRGKAFSRATIALVAGGGAALLAGAALVVVRVAARPAAPALAVVFAPGGAAGLGLALAFHESRP